jgi:hypothetical protein
VGGSGNVAAAGSSGPRQPVGTCEAPIPLVAGTVSGSTARGESANAGSCDKSDAREIVYVLEVAQRQRVTIDVEARYDSVLYIRKDECADEGAEVECNDDAPNGGRTRSRIERVLEPGKYFVFVDGYNQEQGSYKLTVTTSDVLALTDACQRAPLLGTGAPTNASTAGFADDAQASCGGGAQGADAPWRFDLPSRSRVRLVEHSDDLSPVVHVRRACRDEESETACGEALPGTKDAVVAAVMDAGAYTVFADARERDTSGAYTLSLETASPEGTGVAGDGCGDAAPLSAAAGSLVSGDTFAARDDVAGTCGGAGAADVVYRLDVPRRSRLRAGLQSEEGPHVLGLSRRCGDPGQEIACGRGLDEVVAPGTYFLAVDGWGADSLGRFVLSWSLQDLAAQAAACASAPLLADRRTASSTTVGSGDLFAVSCSTHDVTAGGADRVFRLAVASRAQVRVTVTAPTFDVAVALRSQCADAAASASAELACNAGVDRSRRVTLERVLERGTYWVVVDGQTPDQGAFSIDYTVSAAR